MDNPSKKQRLGPKERAKKMQAKGGPELYSTFIFHERSHEMRNKISKGLNLLKSGKEISIKGFGIFIEKVICMTEILKDRFSQPLFQ